MYIELLQERRTSTRGNSVFSALLDTTKDNECRETTAEQPDMFNDQSITQEVGEATIASNTLLLSPKSESDSAMDWRKPWTLDTQPQDKNVEHAPTCEPYNLLLQPETIDEPQADVVVTENILCLGQLSIIKYTSSENL